MAKPVLSAFLVCFFCWPALLAGQTKGAPGALYPPNRFLLIVETSRAMLHRSDQMAQTMQDLLNSGLEHQARQGDSVGVWTFNEELYTGVLSLQEWAPEQQKAISERVVGFLRAQKFEKKARLDRVMPTLLSLAKRSPFLTVVLVCMGDEPIHGTPFDERINEFFQRWRQQQLDARTPFVVALRVQSGQFVDCTMNPAPWPVDLPALPKELFVAKAPPRPPPQAPPLKQPTPVVPPLIVIGKKHEPAPVATNNEPAAAKPAAAEAPATTKLVPPAEAKATPVTQNQGQPKSTETPSNPAPEPNKAGANITPNQKPAPAPSVPSNSTQTAQPLIPPSAQPKMTVSEPSAPTPKPAISASPSDTGAKPQQSAGARELAETARAAQEDHSTRPAASAVEPLRPAPAPVEVAAAAPVRHRPGGLILWLTGGALILAALACLVIWRRRSRPPAEVSIITESFDRRKR